MKKRNLALSALILSQTLTQVTSPAVAASRFDLGGPVLSSASLSIGGTNYRLRIELDGADAFLEGTEMNGVVELVAEDGGKTFIPGTEDSGAMLFQRVIGENGEAKYIGSFCSSSFKDCKEPTQGEKFELTRTGNKSWRATVTTSFVNLADGETKMPVTGEIALQDER